METATLQRLKAAGWKCGRKIDISDFKKRYREIGLKMPAKVEIFAEYFENLLDEYDINTIAYPLGMCYRNELFLVMTITNEFYCFTNGCCEQCGVGIEDMLDCLIGECRSSKTIE